MRCDGHFFSITFQRKKGYVEGFHDFSQGQRSEEIADHVLVFTNRDTKLKIKQPICYSFSSKGSAKGHQIKEKLTQLLRPSIIKTNVEVLNTLIRETKMDCIKTIGTIQKAILK